MKPNWEAMSRDAAGGLAAITGVKQGKAMNNKFQVGDKVRCIATGENEWIRVGDEYTVEISKENSIYIQAKKTPRGFSRLTSYPSSLFELVERASDDLDALIEQANALFPKLHARRDEIEIKLSVECDWETVVAYFDEVKLRRRKAPPALPAPFTLKDSGYQVSFLGSMSVAIGCQTFHTDVIQPALTNLLKENMAMSYEFYASKKGVRHAAGQITWADAEQLLAALEKAGSK